jgi:hypothetical protein
MRRQLQLQKGGLHARVPLSIDALLTLLIARRIHDSSPHRCWSFPRHAMSSSQFDSMNVPLRDVESPHQQQHIGTSESGIQDGQYPHEQYSRSSLFMRWHLYTSSRFIVCSSFLTPNAFLLWKLFAALWTTSVWTFTVIYFTPGRFWYYLTNWNHTAQLLYFTLTAYLALRSYFGRQDAASRSLNIDEHGSKYTGTYHPSARLLRISFVLMQHCFAWTVLVVLVYWTTEFPKWVTQDPSQTSQFSNACIHGVTMVMITIDLLLNRIEYVWPHVLYTIAVSFLYLGVNLTYSLANHTFVYQILQWQDHLLVAILAVIGCTLFVLGMWPIGHAIARARNRKAGVEGEEPEAGLRWCAFRRG